MTEADDDGMACPRPVTGHAGGECLQVGVVDAGDNRGETDPERLDLDERHGAVVSCLHGENGPKLLAPAAVIERDVQSRGSGPASALIGA